MEVSSVRIGGGFTALMNSHMAFFTWDLHLDLVFGDVTLASLFDFEPDDLAVDVPIMPLVEKIVSDDRARVAQSIHRAIETGAPYQETYRIFTRSGDVRTVIAVGRCFRSIDGIPSTYAGVVVEVTGSEAFAQSDPLEMHCRAALEMAELRGKELVSRYLKSALGALNQVGTKRL